MRGIQPVVSSLVLPNPKVGFCTLYDAQCRSNGPTNGLECGECVAFDLNSQRCAVAIPDGGGDVMRDMGAATLRGESDPVRLGSSLPVVISPVDTATKSYPEQQSLFPDEWQSAGAVSYT
ncbi:MAG: hypothetical protein N3G20_05940, partial [Verrucomicrobiae bacterium]|nr:hypothetical protein [Verrucomicrobiae bacterium]